MGRIVNKLNLFRALFVFLSNLNAQCNFEFSAANLIVLQFLEAIP